MTSIGHGLLGDPLYGNAHKHVPMALKKIVAEILEDGRQALHAFELKLIHPRTEEEMVFTCDLPDDLKRLEQTLRDGRPA